MNTTKLQRPFWADGKPSHEDAAIAWERNAEPVAGVCDETAEAGLTLYDHIRVDDDGSIYLERDEPVFEVQGAQLSVEGARKFAQGILLLVEAVEAE